MKLKGGGSLVERPPAFSSDGKLLLVCTGSTVSVYSVATGLLVNVLEGHSKTVTGVNVVQYSGAAKSLINHVWTSSLDGTVRFWDFATGSLIKTVNVGNPVHSMVIPRPSNLETDTTLNHSVAVLMVQWACGDVNGEGKENQKESCFRVVLHNLSSGKPLDGCLATVTRPGILVCSQRGGLVGMVNNRKILIWRVSNKVIEDSKSFQELVLHHTKELLGLAFDPTETVVAGSDDFGQILIWKNVGEHALTEKEDRKQKIKMNAKELDSSKGVRGQDDAESLSTYHWHSHGVNFLKFSLDGAFLFSGGQEAVFVMWQLETGKRQFLPRLGSSLLHCAPSSDASTFSVSCADNSIKLINIGTMTVERTIMGIKPPLIWSARTHASSSTRAAMQPGTGSLVLPARDMSIQFYDVFHDRHTGQVQVFPHNYVSSDKKSSAETCEPVMSITHVVFSKDGSVMATAESRVGESRVGAGCYLKFWKRNIGETDYLLNTQIDSPHETDILSLVYHPYLDMSVSCSGSGEFKVWIQEQHPTHWKCRSVGSYQQKSMHCAAFSVDGTLLAVGAEELITLWNPSTNGLVHVLSHCAKEHVVKRLQAGGTTQVNINASRQVVQLSFSATTNHLIAISKGYPSEMTVWNLETLSICWSYNIEAEDVAVNPVTSHFAVLGRPLQKNIKRKGNVTKTPSFIAVFDFMNPIPLVLWRVHDMSGSILFCFDGSDKTDENKNNKQSHVLYLNRHHEYTVFNPFIEEEEETDSVLKKISRPKTKGLSSFDSVFGRSANVSIKIQSTSAAKTTAQAPSKHFDCPSHLISLNQIGYSYIESLMEKRKVT